MAEPVLLREAQDGVATLTLNRPAQFNALSGELLSALEQATDELAGDRSARVVVLAAAGRGFCAGHDLREIRALGGRAEVEALFLRCSRVMQQLVALPQPVIARVHGIATAAGCQLVASCDLAIASSAARFATPGVNIGAFCATPGVAVSRALARKHALELLLTGEAIDAARAAEIGLVNRVVAPEALDAEVESLAQLLALKSPQALASGKRLFQRQLELPLAEAYALASEAIAGDFASADGAEGVDAFLAKRAPVWKGR
jgi:enoyl-CoA hydratase/carnithine racemase